ncbi:MAG: undecaprenyl-diphosphate phosphatase [Lachnospiraceae bacterium]|nr:undecaprenyl-diphosphate phosphatase [Lachnospiraceae bacterium]
MNLVEVIKVIFYGIVEGITEWLPVSSTGHLILFESLWPLNQSENFMEMFRVVIQLGAILAVCVLYFQRLNPFSRSHSLAEKNEIFGIWGKVIVGCIPAGVLGVLFNDFFDEYFYNWPVVAFTLILYGVLFILIENRNRGRRPRVRSFRQMTYPMALLIGCCQVLSLVPGTSRSGSSILGAMFFGVSRPVAAEFSFFMAIPIMFGASLLKLVKYGLAFTVSELICLFLGMVIAFVVSLAAIRFLMDYVKRHDFRVFGYYRIVLGIVVVVYFAGKALLAA